MFEMPVSLIFFGKFTNFRNITNKKIQFSNFLP